jgi:hypothetical protein
MNTIQIEDYKINPFVEAKMIWISGGSWKNETNGNVSDEKLLLDVCNVETPEQLLEWVIEFIGEVLPTLNVEQWLADANGRTEYIERCKKFYDNSKGFPIDYRLLNNYMKKGFKICAYFTNEVNSKYGAIWCNLSI